MGHRAVPAMADRPGTANATHVIPVDIFNEREAMEAIKVSVVEFGDRKHYQMQFRDPVTRRKQTKSTGVERTGLKRDRTEAERVAAKWEAELREGRYHAPNRTTWSDFRQRYEDKVIAGMADQTATKLAVVFDLVEAVVNPSHVRDLTATRLSFFQSKLRDGRADTTVRSYLAHLGAALKWAQRMGFVATVPTLEKPKRTKASVVMKGRPITGEEFDRMLAKVSAVVGGRPGGDLGALSPRLVDFGAATWRIPRTVLGPGRQAVRRSDYQAADAADSRRTGKRQPGPSAADRSGVRRVPVDDPRCGPHGPGFPAGARTG